MPNTREKLLDIILQGIEIANQKCGEQESCENCQYQAPKGCTWGIIADHLIANGVTIQSEPLTNCQQSVAYKWSATGVTVQEWIPVTERLPEFAQPCLCYKKTHGHPEYRLGTYIGATFSDNCAAFKSMSHFGCIGATHWMPLPEPPNREG